MQKRGGQDFINFLFIDLKRCCTIFGGNQLNRLSPKGFPFFFLSFKLICRLSACVRGDHQSRAKLWWWWLGSGKAWLEGGKAEEEKEEESEFKSAPNSEEEEGKPLRAWAHGFLWPYVLERNF